MNKREFTATVYYSDGSNYTAKVSYPNEEGTCVGLATLMVRGLLLASNAQFVTLETPDGQKTHYKK